VHEEEQKKHQEQEYESEGYGKIGENGMNDGLEDVWCSVKD